MVSPIRFLRLPDVLARRGKKRTAHYADVARGMFSPPVRLGARASGWPAHEVDALQEAVLAGKKPEEIRELVSSLVAARQGRAALAGAA
jgi:prophage regulatory protein